MPNRLDIARPLDWRGEMGPDIPANAEPYWLGHGNRLAGFQSNSRLPDFADVVVIGAGLTGASAAYHLARLIKGTPTRVVVIDKGDPAGEASGRNGGNFQLIPENSVGDYEGLTRERLAFLKRVYRGLPPEVLRAESERQASVVLAFSLRNRELFKSIIVREQIDCDFSPRGWLHLAGTDEEEQGICEEVALAAQHGQQVEIWSRRKIRQEMQIDSEFLGRFIPGDGSYHPVKYVSGLLESALAGGIALYTRTPVRAIVSGGPDRHSVITDRGTIVASSIVVGTNAFTAQLLPELVAIRPHQSQIQLTENAPERMRGRVVTSENGPVFFNQPRGGASNGFAPLLMGGGLDRPMANPSSRRRSAKIHRQLLAIRDRFFPELHGCKPSAEWVGPMGFTPDELPAIGLLRPGIIIAAAYNGYGGTYTTAAGLAAAQIALTSEVPEWVPEDVFSPKRLTMPEPIFMTRHDSLWRVAASLCRQLKVVNGRISEALFIAGTPGGLAPISRQAVPTIGDIGPADTIPAATVAALSAFSAFTVSEIDTLLKISRPWELKKSTRLFSEGDPGGSCFIVVRGSVDVSINVNGRDQLLARLREGAIFGQVSLFTSELRSATCTIHEDALLAELEPVACQRVFDSHSPLALKLVEVLNDGIVYALRRANRRLLSLESFA